MKKNILFVDDDPNILDSFRAMLHRRRKEWAVHTANSGEEALEYMERERMDLVVADIRMPGMDGVQLLNRVRELHPETARVVLSGYSEFSATLNAVKPAHQFLMKPCQPEVLQSVLDRLLIMKEMLQDDTLRQVINGIDSLPALPDLYIKITEELSKAEPSLKRIGSLVERDIAISAALLKVVNSAFFGLYSKVSSPAQAVLLLGAETLQGLILGIHFLNQYERNSLPGLNLDNLWKHSLNTAYFAKAIGKAEGGDAEFVDACFLGGLLHDVGKLVLAMEFTEDYIQVLEAVRADDCYLYKAERFRFHVSHAEVGAYLLGTWGISEHVVGAVNSHHDLERIEGPGLTPVIAAHVANCLDHELIRYNKNYTFSPLDMKALERLGLDQRLDAWREICQQLLDKGGEHET